MSIVYLSLIRLRREERRRKLQRVSSLRGLEPEVKRQPQEEKKKVILKIILKMLKKILRIYIQTVVCDKLGNEIYVRGEGKPEKWAR